MDQFDLVARLDQCATNWRIDASRYFGRRRAWRLARAAQLQKMANDLFSALLK